MFIHAQGKKERIQKKTGECRRASPCSHIVTKSAKGGGWDGWMGHRTLTQET